MTNYDKRRLRHWRVIHGWNIIRHRRRVIIGSVIFGILVAAIITVTIRPVFFSRATIQDNCPAIFVPPPPYDPSVF
jgi:hypothetical protein